MAAEPLSRAARARHQDAVARAEHALRDLGHEGASISFQAVARRAGVSRQSLYTQPKLRVRIEQLRDRRPTPSASVVPNGERARERSLRQRNETLLADNRRLRAENQTLRDELAVLYRQLRAHDER